MEKTISMSELAKHAERIARDIEATGTVYRIKRPGRRKLMLVDNDYLERWQATVELMLQHPNLEAELAQADRDFREGRCVPLETVRRELGLEDAQPHSVRHKPTRRASANRRKKSR